MSSNDIKSTHDENPTGCDDAESDYYLQTVKDDGTAISDEGMSIPQLRSILQIDPGSAVDVFQMSIPDNTLNAIVGTLFGDYTHWQIIQSTTPPLFTDTDWKSWPMPTLFNVAEDPSAPVTSDWLSKTWSLYTKDSSIVHTILTAQGADSVTVTPTDTIGPNITSYSISTGTTATSQIAVTYTVTDTGSGLARVDVYDSSNNSVLAFDYASGADITVNATLYPPGSEVGVYIIATDNALTPNTTSTFDTPVSVTLDGITSGTVSLAIPTDTLETAGDFASVATRSGGSTDEVYVKFVTPDYDVYYPTVQGTHYYPRKSFTTATLTRLDATHMNINQTDIGLSVDTGDYVEVVSTGGTWPTSYTAGTADGPIDQCTVVNNNNIKVPWGAGGDPGVGNDSDGTDVVHIGIFRWADGNSADKTINVKLIDADNVYNSMFQGELTPGSAVNVDTPSAPPIIGTDAYQFTILGSGGSTSTFIQEGQHTFNSTTDVGSDQITITGHPFSNGDDGVYSGDCVRGNTYDTLGPTEGQTVYIKNIDANTIELYEEVGLSTQITLTAGGAETHCLYSQDYGDQILNIPADQYSSLTASVTSTNWAEASGDPLADGTRISTNVMQTPTAPNSYTLGGTPGVSTDAEAPRCNYDIFMPISGAHNIELVIASENASPADTAHVWFDGSTWYSGAFYKWTAAGTYGIEDLNVPTVLNVGVPGAHTISVLQREDRDDVYLDAIVMGLSTVTLTESLVISRTQAGTSTDDPSNPPDGITILPTPGGATVTPDVFFPEDSQTAVALTVDPYVEWLDATEISVTTSIIEDAASNSIGHSTVATYQVDRGRLTFPLLSQLSANTTYTITATGSVVISGVRSAFSISNTEMNFTTTVGDTGANVIFVDFEDATFGAVTNQYLIDQFDVWTAPYTGETLHGPDYNSLDIVQDPTGGNRGKVMRVQHREGFKGSGPEEGGMRFRCNVPAADEYYFAFDLYLPTGHTDSDGRIILPWFQPLQAKMPGMINGTMLEASHLGGVTPTPDLLAGANAQFQLFSDAAYPPRGIRTLASPYYDKDSVQAAEFFDSITPTLESLAGNVTIPVGVWTTIEQRVTKNTVAPAALKDGLLQVWVNGNLVSNKTHRWFADTNYGTNQVDTSGEQWDGMWMYSHYGGSNVELNIAPYDNHHYFDNLIISTAPISH